MIVPNYLPFFMLLLLNIRVRDFLRQLLKSQTNYKKVAKSKGSSLIDSVEKGLS